MNSNQIIGLISVVVVGIVSKLFWKFVNGKIEKDLDTNSNIIKGKKMLTIFSIVSVFLITGIFVFVLIFTDSHGTDDIIALILIFGVLGLTSLGLLIYSVNWKLELHEDYCIYTNCFKKKKKYFYKDLRVVEFSGGYKIYFDKHKAFEVNMYKDNWLKFPEIYEKNNGIITIK